MRCSWSSASEDVALETSFGNGGVLHTSEAEPWSRPGMPTNIWKWLGKEDAPMLLRYSALPGMWRWGLEFIRNCTLERYRRSTMLNLRLSFYTLRCIEQIRAGDRDRLRSDAKRYAQDLYATASARAEPRRMRDDARARHGRSRPSTPNAASPSSRPSRRSRRRWRAGCSSRPTSTVTATSSPPVCGSTARTSSGSAATSGPRSRRCTSAGDRIEGVETSRGQIRADRYVAAMGSYTPLHLRPLGIRARHLSRQGRHGDRARRAVGPTARRCRSSTTRGCSA